ITNDTRCEDTLNTATVVSRSGPFVNGVATGIVGNTNSASAQAFVKKIAVNCAVLLSSDAGSNQSPGSIQLLIPGPVQVTLCITNTGDTNEIITRADGLPPLVVCADGGTPSDVNTLLGLPKTLGAGDSYCTVVGCVNACSNGIGANF